MYLGMNMSRGYIVSAEYYGVGVILWTDGMLGIPNTPPIYPVCNMYMVGQAAV